MGDGASVKFWTDKWLGRDAFSSLFSSLYSKVESKNASVADMGEWGVSGWRWNTVFAVDMTADDVHSVVALAELLLDVAPLRATADSWKWTLDSMLGFTVKNCYSWLLSFFTGERGRLEERVVNACAKLWRNEAPSKVLIFSWRLLLNKLATKDALERRGVLTYQNDLACALCSNGNETVKHLFFEFQVACEVWRLVTQWVGVLLTPEDDVIDNFAGFGKFLKGKKRKRVKHIIWLAVTWCLWSSRNKVLFQGEVASVSKIVEAIKFSSWGWFMARSGRKCGVSWTDWLCCPMGCLLSL